MEEAGFRPPPATPRPLASLDSAGAGGTAPRSLPAMQHAISPDSLRIEEEEQGTTAAEFIAAEQVCIYISIYIPI